jgi:hypothetical protein
MVGAVGFTYSLHTETLLSKSLADFEIDPTNRANRANQPIDILFVRCTSKSDSMNRSTKPLKIPAMEKIDFFFFDAIPIDPHHSKIKPTEKP